ncbi:MAG: hypothetical protein ABSA02_10470 [Trebonia sp.]|jgi:hypothetical protein
MAGIGSGDGAEEAGRRRRQFIREHHPDRGGDAESFIAGLRAIDAEQASEGPPPRVVVVPHQSWPSKLAAAAVRRLRHGSKPPRVR